jgi:hypothetical protein
MTTVCADNREDPVKQSPVTKKRNAQRAALHTARYRALKILRQKKRKCIQKFIRRGI